MNSTFVEILAMRNISSVILSVTKGLFLPISLILLIQAGASRALSVSERDLPLPGLRQVPLELGKWSAPSEQLLERGITEYLKPDEYILRDYVNKDASSAINLFAAYFKSLQNVYGPHSPQVCLPGSGWLIRSSKIEEVQGAERGKSIPVNEFILEKSNDRILVIYWYQNDRNVWAEEFQAKLKLLPDLIRYRRSDVSLVRLITPLGGVAANNGLTRCLEFTKLVFPPLAERFRTTK
jgi:EpsI family protein